MRVMGMNREHTAAVEVVVDCKTEGEASVALDSEALAAFFEPLVSSGVLLDVCASSGALTLLAYFGRSPVQLRFPAEPKEYLKLKLPEPKFRGSAFGVFEETVRHLKKLKGSDTVRVRVRAESGKLTVEPPRRVFPAEEAAEPVEVRVEFRDLRAVLEAFKAAELAIEALWLSEHILGLEASFGRARATGLVAGQVD